MSVRRFFTAAGGLVTALAVVPLSQLHAQGQISQLSQDSKLIFEMASSNILEVRLGQLAQEKASNPAVKQFGQQMVTEHTNLQNQLTGLVSKNNASFKPGMTDADEKEVERLDKVSGADFDRTYMSSMVQHHQEDVSFLQSQGQAARSAEARQIVSASLPVLQQHLNMAIQVGNQVGATTTVAQNPPVVTGNPPVATQTPPVTQSSQADVAADMSFIREAASANLMEIRLGQTAQSRASNSAVKQFAQRMVSDHANLENQLTTTVSSSGQSFTPSIDAHHQREITRLERLSGAEFDRSYMGLMIRAHQQDVAKFQTQSQSARSSQVRTLASNSLPVLQQHLSLATQVGSQVGADTATVIAGPNRPGNEGRGNGNRRTVSDAEFMRDIGAGSSLEIRLAEVARKDVKNKNLKQLADRLKDDFTDLQKRWSNLAERSGQPHKPGFGQIRGQQVEELEDAKGKNFDRTYATLIVRHLHDMLTYWQEDGRAAKSPQLRQFVNSEIPTIERNLVEAKQAARQVGVNPDEVLRNRTDLSRARGTTQDRNKAD